MRVCSEITAKEIMTFPVKTLEENISIEKALDTMIQFGYSSFPVTQNDSLKGIITRDDIMKSKLYRLTDITIKDIMSRKIKTISTETEISIVRQELLKLNIKSLLVVEQNRVVGIVTRSDLSYCQYNDLGNQAHHNTNINTNELLESISNEIQIIFKNISEIADQLNFRAYVVGGFVRDLFLGRETSDIDIIVVGSGITLAKAFVDKYGGELITHEIFHTATIILNQDLSIDIVTARREFYRYPGALPVVENGSIYDDLYRRDFSINSMAILLNKCNYGKLIDYFGGIQDLEYGRIRILHNLSFIEDPTRILRAIRFESRLGFKIEYNSQGFAEYAVKNGYLSKVSKERIIREIKLALQEREIDRILLRMQQMNIIEYFHPRMKITNQIIESINRIDDIQLTIKRLCRQKGAIRKINIMLYIFFIGQPYEKISEVLKELPFNKTLKKKILELVSFIKSDLSKLNKPVDIWVRYQSLINLSMEQIIALLCYYADKTFQINVGEFLYDHKDVRFDVDATDLISIGVPSDRQIKFYLDAAKKYKLENINANREEVLQHIKTKLVRGEIN